MRSPSSINSSQNMSQSFIDQELSHPSHSQIFTFFSPDMKPWSFPDAVPVSASQDPEIAALWDTSLVQTLPFDHTKVDRPITEAVLQRTRERWSWFVDAQQINPAFGTLSYLPAEVRQMIFDQNLSCHPTSSADGLWEYDHGRGSPLDISAYYFGNHGRGVVDASLSGLRLVSSALRAEFEDVFLSKRTFRFNDPESLAVFFRRLNKAQSSRVLSIEIGFCILYQTELWIEPMSQLPRMLNNIHFKIYTAFNDYLETKEGQRALGILGNLVTSAAVGAPKAHISICGTGKASLTPACTMFAHKILGSLPRKLEHSMLDNMQLCTGTGGIAGLVT